MNLRLYLQLEQETLRLDDAGDDELAEKIRTLMDCIWHERLSPLEKADLNARGHVKIVTAGTARVEAGNKYAGQNLGMLFTGTANA